MNNAPPAILDALNSCSPLSVPASQTALLLLDFHKFIITSQPNEGKDALATAENLREWARVHDILVIHCMIDLKAVTASHQKMASRANGVRDKMKGHPEISGEPSSIAALADEYTFWRPPSHISAMGSYGVEAFLAEHDIKSLILAGFSTSGCVINTAKGATDKGFIVTIVDDACGDKSPEVHEVIMKKLLIGQAHVVDSQSLTKAWGEVSAASDLEKLNL
jgi:nicotinamidase-related amidase